MAFSLVRLPNNTFALRPWDSRVIPQPTVRITRADSDEVLFEGEAKPFPMRLPVAIDEPIPALAILS